MAELCAGIEAQTDHVHTLINNAGATWGAPLEEYPSEAFDKLMALNVRSVFQTTQRLLPLLRKGTNPTWPASIINIGSINGLGVSVLETYAYAASKAAVHHLTRVLAARLAADHVTVNAIAPGPFPTKMTKHVLETFREQIVERVPLGRVGRPSDLTGLCIALASRAGSYTSGAVIPVDGGALIQASL